MTGGVLNIRGLTLIQPWCTAIVAGGKRVENRTWRPPPSLGRLGGGELWLALHAGNAWDASGALEFIRTLWAEAPTSRNDYPAGAILGVARVARAVRLANCPDVKAGKLARHGATEPAPLSVPDEDLGPWAFGPWCWMLEDVRPLLEPVKVRGAMGLWGIDKMPAREQGIVKSSILLPRAVAS